MKEVPNFIDYQVGNAKPAVEKTAIAQDQDTVIGDAMVEASIIVYDAAKNISRHIAENAQYAIDLSELHKAELALAYMQGVDFGLAMDVKRDKTYLAYMEKTMASIRKSKEAGFQLQIDMPPEPWKFIGFDEKHARANGPLFIHALNTCPPAEKHIKELEDEMYRSEGKDPGMMIPDPNDPTGKTLVMAPLNGVKDTPAAQDSAPKKNSSPKAVANRQKYEEHDPADKKAELSDLILESSKSLSVSISNLRIEFKKGDKGDYWELIFSIPECSQDGYKRQEMVEAIAAFFTGRGFKATGHCIRGGKWSCAIYVNTGVAKDSFSEDAIPEVNRLRDLYRTHRIGRDAYQGGIATMLATGLINKSEFTRLNGYRI